MNWELQITDEADKDFEGFDNSQQIEMMKAVRKVLQNPLPFYEGGYGVPLGNKYNINLTGAYKIKLKKSGLRIVYELIRDKQIMRILVFGSRNDEDAYYIAAKRQHRS
jgi:mRNA interferase RelE/StbE